MMLTDYQPQSVNGQDERNVAGLGEILSVPLQNISQNAYRKTQTGSNYL